MGSTSLVRSGHSAYSRDPDYPDDYWPEEPPGRWRGAARFAMAVVIGAGATLLWQWYGDRTIEKLTGALPQAWLGPGHHASSRAADRQQLQDLSDRLAATDERLDQLSQKVAVLGALLSRAGAGSSAGGVADPGPRVEGLLEQTAPAGNPLPKLVASSSPAPSESSAGVGVEPRQLAGEPARSGAPGRQKQTQVAEQAAPAAAVSPEEICKRDAARLARLRMSQARDEIAAFERDLGCEELRPQVLRLRESVDP